jgi:hypothetical protein
MAALVFLCPAFAKATDGEDFQNARQAYDRGDYAQAVELFAAMVGGEDPAIRDPILIRESRKYLGAAYVLTGENELAEAQFERLLRSVDRFETYLLEAEAFPAPVLRVFRIVRQRLIDERNRIESEAERVERENRERQAEAQRRLLELARESEVDIEHDRALAWLPFGAGQFQNGNGDLGTFFAVSESIALAGAIAALSAWVPINDQYQDSLAFRGPPPDTRLLVGLQVSNWVTFGAFGVLALAGVIEANVNFVPSHRERRRRDVDPELLEQLQLSIGPASLGLRLRF